MSSNADYQLVRPNDGVTQPVESIGDGRRRLDDFAGEMDLELRDADGNLIDRNFEADDDAETVDHDDPVDPIDAPNEAYVEASDAEIIDTETEGLPDRSVGDDPIKWLDRSGEHFVDYIDGSPAITRQGFEVLSHFYGIAVKEPEVMVGPAETDFEYCQVRATAVTSDGRECSALGSAHVDRGDDKTLLLEMADTRARKRALSIATGVGAVAVEELRNEVDR